MDEQHAGTEEEGNKGEATTAAEEEFVRFGTTKRIMRLDPDTKQISMDAAKMVGKATEMFLQYFIKTVCEEMQKSGAHNIKLLTYGDIAKIVSKNEEFEFLRELIVEPPPLPTTTEQKR